MNELQILERDGVLLANSRDVAEMIGRNHKEVLRDIRQYGEYLAGSNFALGDFFIECTYLDGNKQTRPNYLITKKGCDMIANKMTGSKGVLFTAAYIERFDEMERVIKNERYSLPSMTQTELIAAIAQSNMGMEHKLIGIERKHAELEQKISKAVGLISEPFSEPWVSNACQAIRMLGDKMKINDIDERLFAELEVTAHCNLNRRFDGYCKRELARTKSKWRFCTKMDVVNDDPKLKVIFEGIIRKYQAKYGL